MHKIYVIFIISYVISLVLAYFIKIGIYKVATKAINEKKLSTGIFTLFSVEGNKAVELAKGYINGARIFFWFVVIFWPLLFLLSIIQGSI